ncbi:hypothetical protein LX32DRAFT_42317 [Colletotrichum zoysiae]|uniref:Uncharacterized protein n=1 Tax=Colletotrichum zoysiae TaxID=1216348 RepID=A0AAD9M9E1_9PEZI|nr:hypothetical protein LX32DRAFT_42317 [Colletotrichum zoysiae]
MSPGLCCCFLPRQLVKRGHPLSASSVAGMARAWPFINWAMNEWADIFQAKVKKSLYGGPGFTAIMSVCVADCFISNLHDMTPTALARIVCQSSARPSVRVQRRKRLNRRTHAAGNGNGEGGRPDCNERHQAVEALEKRKTRHACLDSSGPILYLSNILPPFNTIPSGGSDSPTRMRLTGLLRLFNATLAR